MDLHHKDVLVIGAKRSGLAAIRLLREHKARVRAMDAQALTADESGIFEAMGVPVSSQNSEHLAAGGKLPDLIVLSPGVPFDLPLLESVREHSIPVVGEVELAAAFLQGPILGITGSNGKTTTTALTGYLLTASGIPCQVGGNIGTAVASLVASSSDEQWNVLELSSFQLESIVNFRPRIAACLNITPDHLDRHGNLENYIRAKGRIFDNQTATDFAVLNYDDPACRAYADRTKAQIHWFSSTRPVPSGIWLKDEQLLNNQAPFLHRSQIKIRGIHNVENVMAAALCASLAGAALDRIAAAVEIFPGVEHRIEFVRHLSGVDYFNDSKATNVDAALKAIEAFPGGLWIILGGKDKGSGYTPLREPLAQKAKAALLIGEPSPYPHAAAPLIEKALSGALPVENCRTLAAAVAYAHDHAGPGDVVLLSPACASFDQFKDFEDRGKTFKHLVSELF